VPPAPLLAALEDGELRAAITVATGAAIADPFTPTVLQTLLIARSGSADRRKLCRGWATYATR
jgi:hypothetical protein